MALPSSASLPGLLRCLDAGFFIQSFEDEGYVCVNDLRVAGRDTVAEFVHALSMPREADEKLLALAFAEDKEETPPAEGEVGSLNLAAVACSGSIFSRSWFEAVAPLYNLKMGCENMGPLLHSLVRFVKPSCCLEIGAGYTSAFLLQALEDNASEAKSWQDWIASSPDKCNSWLSPAGLSNASDDAKDSSSLAVLHCVDNWAHSGTTAPRLLSVARRLGLEHRLQLHIDDARSFLDESASSIQVFDFVWLDGLLDFAPPLKGGDVAGGIDAFLNLVWPRVKAGGLVLLHSTLTNSAVRGWLRGIDKCSWGPAGSVLSLLEPWKRFQNSVTLLQKRPHGYSEPVYSTLP